MTIKQALQDLKSKKLSATELVSSYLDRIEKFDDKVNAFITVNKDEALEKAKQIENNPKCLPLEGIPIALKDLYLTKNVKTTAAARLLENHIGQYNATVVQKLENAGAIIIGKLNQDAWAHGASGENSDFGPTKNPWNFERVAGGSSSGAGASIASDFCLASGGSDTGGSIRAPASFCGNVGLKPTYGRVSRFGIIAMASSLDSIGHITNTVWDNAKYLEISAGHDPLDATTPNLKVPNYTDILNKEKFNIKSLKIGIPKEYFPTNLNPEVKDKIQEAIKKLEENGAKIAEISLPHTEYGIAVYYVIQPSEVSSNLGRYDGVRYGHNRSYFSDEAKRRIMIGTYTLSAGYYDAYYKKANKVRTLIKNDFEKAFESVDVIIAPVMPTPAFKIGEKQNPLDMYLADIFTAPINLAGLPSLSIPSGFSQEKLPIGMQIIGPQFKEDLLFQVGHYYQQITDWHNQKPKLD